MPLHLVVYHTRAGDAAVLGGLEMPRLLFKYPTVGEEQRMKHGVKVDSQHIGVIGLPGRSKIVQGLIGIGTGIQIHRHGGFHQIDEGLLQGIFFGSVEAGMLENMENAGVVLGDGAERDAEHKLSVVTVAIIQGRAARLVHVRPHLRPHVGNGCCRQKPKAVSRVTDLHIHRSALLLSRPSARTAIQDNYIIYPRIMQGAREDNKHGK